MPITIRVRRRLGPRKQAAYDVWDMTARSCSVVASIRAICLSRSNAIPLEPSSLLSLLLLLVSFSRTARASSRRPRRTSHHGDSGANQRRGTRRAGQTHLHV